ncbi:two-component response regulator-like APRR5 [Asparagus officinalis]|uniref:two-component response regulator-like APRR5 n=1 Tax=Asparagus officinalis TaxID=4686 RepID=UPI00098E52ED|nr:two-component response regulator-like APRR5 [Asparagus officinalis]
MATENDQALGRSWKAKVRTVVIESEIGDVIRPEGGDVWDGADFHQTCSKKKRFTDQVAIERRNMMNALQIQSFSRGHVVAVSDGQKTWEIVRERPGSINVVLVEVEVPSISGTSLLSMIMDHEGCKHIPVIMMSFNNSVNIVFNCMLKGAADFLMKPVRKNELRNLWQHVWRRQTG